MNKVEELVTALYQDTQQSLDPKAARDKASALEKAFWDDKNVTAADLRELVQLVFLYDWPTEDNYYDGFEWKSNNLIPFLAKMIERMGCDNFLSEVAKHENSFSSLHFVSVACSLQWNSNKTDTKKTQDIVRFLTRADTDDIVDFVSVVFADLLVMDYVFARARENSDKYKDILTKYAIERLWDTLPTDELDIEQYDIDLRDSVLKNRDLFFVSDLIFPCLSRMTYLEGNQISEKRDALVHFYAPLFSCFTEEEALTAWNDLLEREKSLGKSLTAYLDLILSKTEGPAGSHFWKAAGSALPLLHARETKSCLLESLEDISPGVQLRDKFKL